MAPKSAPATTPSATTAVESLWKAYSDNTSKRLKFVDSFLLFLMLSGIVQFVYCILVSDFPYNAFLAGCVYGLHHVGCGAYTAALFRFASNVGQFVLTASLRSQVNPDNKDEFKEVSPERFVITFTHKLLMVNMNVRCRAFADFALGSIVLHFFVYNFLG